MPGEHGKVNKGNMSWMEVTWPGGCRSPLTANNTSRVDAVNMSLALDRFYGVFSREGVLPTAMKL